MAEQIDSPQVAPVDSSGVETNPPSTDFTTIQVGAPSLPAISRGIVKKTIQEFAAENRIHNCDICAGLNKDIASAKAEVMAFVGGLRTSIEEIFSGTASNPAVEDIKQTIAAAKAKIKLIKKEIEPIQEQIKAMQEYIQKMQEIIQEIQNAPAELAALLQACLAEATGSLQQTMNEVKSLATGTVTEAVAAVVDPIKSEIKEITDTVSATETVSVTQNTPSA